MKVVYLGEIVKTVEWKADTDPFSLFKKLVELPKCGYSMLESGSRWLRNEIQADWGSWLWKGNRDEIEHFLEAEGICVTRYISKLKQDKDYAIVYIECY